jgi:hypothetical protein
MKTLLIFLIGFSCFSQVGVGTTNPQNDLHVEGGLRVTDLPIMMSHIRYVVADTNGDFGVSMFPAIRRHKVAEPIIINVENRDTIRIRIVGLRENVVLEIISN